MKKIMHLIFIVVAILAILEYYFIAGAFTGSIMLAAIFLVGILNTGYSIFQKSWNETALYAIATIAICIGYLKLM